MIMLYRDAILVLVGIVALATRPPRFAAATDITDEIDYVNSFGRAPFTSTSLFNVYDANDCPAVSHMDSAAAIPAQMAGKLLSPLVVLGCSTAHGSSGRIAVFGHVDPASAAFTHIATISGSDIGAGGQLGTAVSIDVINGEYVIAASAIADGGHLYLFRQRDPSDPLSGWRQFAKEELYASNDCSTTTHTMDGNVVMVGCRFASSSGHAQNGVVVFHTIDLAAESTTQVVGVEGVGSYTWQGTVLSMSGNRAVATATNDWSGGSHGRVYVLETVDAGASWSTAARIGGPGSMFGRGISMVGSTVCCGSSDSAFIYQETATNAWTQLTELVPKDSMYVEAPS